MSLPLEATGLTIKARLQASDLRLLPATLTALVGPNGSGKTSLLRALGGIEGSAGSIRVSGEDLSNASPARRRELLSFLPAAREVVWPIPVRDVISLGLNRPNPGRLENLLESLELQSLADRSSERLSTGERARVLLGRALAPNPRVLLLDEPLSNLDPYWVLKTIDLLREAVADDAAALVSVHDLSLVGQFDRALLMSEGRIVLDEEPDELIRSPLFGQVFRVEAGEGAWRLIPPADPRSSR